MPRRLRLGKTGIEVSAVALGCWQFSGGQGLAGRFWEAIPQAVVDRLVEASLAENCQALDLVLSPDDLRRLGDVSSRETRV